MSKDLNEILEGWDYHPNEVTVRKVMGLDGKEKIQMRIPLGLFQMEMTGRPDGKKPNGFESYFDYYLNKLKKYIKQYGSDEGFSIRSGVFVELSQEALQYYYRYLSLFILGDYEYVVRDTARNLKLFDFIKKYAKNELDISVLEQYRPYVIMMNSRARAYLAMKHNDYDKAEGIIEKAMVRIEQFYVEDGHPENIQSSYELNLLRQVKAEVTEKMPVNYIAKLKVKMDEAVKQENYEKAAELRDLIKKIKGQNSIR